MCLYPLSLVLFGYHIVEVIQMGDSSATYIDQVIEAWRQSRKHVSLMTIVDQLCDLASQF
jgi:hypothetical protein